jgi:hypothetical protein
MSKIISFLEFKKKYSVIYNETKEKFTENNLSMKDYDLDYFHYDKLKNEFFISFSIKNLDKLSNVDVKGEYLDDEIVITSFSESKSTSGEDFYDIEEYRIPESEEDQHDSDY